MAGENSGQPIFRFVYKAFSFLYFRFFYDPLQIGEFDGKAYIQSPLV